MDAQQYLKFSRAVHVRPNGRRLAIVVLHYGCYQHTLRCVHSLLTDSSEQIEIIVVDNGTHAQQVINLDQSITSVHLVLLGENMGWAGGCNAGIKKAQALCADFICLLNNDTEVPGAMSLYKMTGLTEIYGPCLMHPAIDSLDSNKIVQMDPSIHPWSVPLDEKKTVFELNYAYGACLMFPVEIVNKIGLLDERFFLQLEESDFYERAIKSGYRSICDVSVRIRHAISAGYGSTMPPLKYYYIVRNTLLIIEKNRFKYSFIRAKLKAVYWLTHDLVAQSGNKHINSKLFVWVFTRHIYARAFRRAIFDYAFRRFGRAPTVMERLNG